MRFHPAGMAALLLLSLALSAPGFADHWESFEEGNGDERAHFCCSVDSVEMNISVFTGTETLARCERCGATPAVCAVEGSCFLMDSNGPCPGTHSADELPLVKVAVCGRNVCRVQETGGAHTLFARCFADMKAKNLHIPTFRDGTVTPAAAGANP